MWIIQEMPNDLLEEDSNYIKIRKVLEKKKIPYIIVIYKDGILHALDNENYTILDNSSEVLKKALSEPFIPRGSVKLTTDTKDNRNSLFYDSELDFDNVLDFVSENDLLNPPDYVGYLKDLHPIADEFMVRPVKDNKAITGTVMTEGEFYQLKKYGKDYHNGDLIVNSEFMLSPIKHIKREFRFFIVKGKISTYSQYMLDKRVHLSDTINQQSINFVNRLIKNIPKKSYVLDVAELTNGEYKMIEFNSLSSSGFYAINVEKLVKDIEKSKGV